MLKKATKRKILYAILSPLVILLLKFIYATCKVCFHGDFVKQNSILAGWHGEILLMPFCYKKKNIYNKTFCVIASPHGDGQFIAKIIRFFVGGVIISGSSKKGGSNALRQSLKLLKKPGYDLAIAPDGPRGPRHSVAQGCVVISQLLNIPIQAVNLQCSSFWEFNTWDKMRLPKPFSKIEFHISEPFFLKDLELEEAKSIIKQRLGDNAHT